MNLIIDDNKSNRKYVDADNLEFASTDSILKLNNIDDCTKTSIIMNVLLSKFNIKNIERQTITYIVAEYYRHYLKNEKLDSIDITNACKRLQALHKRSVKIYESAINKLKEKEIIETIPNTNRIILADKYNIFKINELDNIEYIVIKL